MCLLSLPSTQHLECLSLKSCDCPVVLYGFETWSLMLGKEHRLRVFKNRVMRKMEEETGECRKLHIEELHDVY